MTDQSQDVKIEIENENEDDAESIESKPTNTEQTTSNNDTHAATTANVPRKRIDELTENERSQIIANAKSGIENEHYNVHFFKNGGTRITLKKQTKAQELIKLNDANPERPTPAPKYLTDNQLLFEHVINLETQYSKLHAKHKKLKKRYNELEGYLYANDSDDDDEKPQPKQMQMQAPEQQRPKQMQEVNRIPDAQPIQQTPYVQRRYVRNWRMINPIQNQQYQ